MPRDIQAESRLAAILPPQLGSHYPTDRLLQQAARQRHGVLTLDDLARLGLSGRAVRDRAASGRLHRVHRGVYSVGTPTAQGVQKAIDRTEELRLFDLHGLRSLLERRRGQRGSAVLMSILAEYDGPAETQSVAEERLLALVSRARLPAPEVNAWIPLPEGSGYRPDFLWRDRRLVVEVDGRSYHARHRAFQHDRRRDRRLALAGYETRRYAAREVLRQPSQVISELRAFLNHHAG